MLLAIISGTILIAAGVIWAFGKEKLSPLWISALGVIVALIGASATFVPTGYVGIRTIHGQIQDRLATPGKINYHTPFFESIDLVNCKQKEIVFDKSKFWCDSSDMTEFYAENVAVDYQIIPSEAAWIWQNIEEYDNNLIKQRSFESAMKAAGRLFDDENVMNRANIEPAVRELLQKELDEKYKKHVVDILSVSIGNMNFKESYNKLIDERSKAKKKADIAKYKAEEKKVKAEGEAEVQKIQAEAEAERKKIEAQGEADAAKIRSDAEAEANKKVSQSLTPELLEHEKIHKWDGKTPIVTGNGSTIVDVGDVTKEEKK